MSAILLVLSIIAFGVNIFLQILVAKASFITIIISVIPYVIIICLLWELRSDTKKINRMEDLLYKKGIIQPDEVYEPIYTSDTPQEKKSHHKKTDNQLCPHCNVPIDEDSTICPNCQMPVTNQTKSKKK